jgi:membrane protein
VLLGHLRLQNVIDALFRLAPWPFLLALVITGLAVLYRFGPTHRNPRWHWISVGSVFAAAVAGQFGATAAFPLLQQPVRRPLRLKCHRRRRGR